MDLTVSGKNDKKGWYHPERDLEGKVVFLSTFENARQMSASIDHVSTQSQISTKTEVSWESNKKINTDLTVTKRNGWKDAIITIQTSTPFERLRTAKYLHDYSIRGNTYETKNRLDWGQKFAELSLTGSGDVANHAFEGGVTLRTSYPGYKRMAVSAKHTDNSQIFNTQLQATLRDGSTMTAAFNMNHERSGWHINNRGDLSVSLPMGPYRKNKLIWNHRNNDGLFKSRAELQLDTEKTIFDLDSTHVKTAALNTLDVKTSFTSPYSPVNDLAFNLNQKYNPQSLEGMVTTSSVKWATNKVITVTKNTDIRPGQLYKTIVVVTTPFQGYKRLSAHIEDNRVGDKMTVKREYKWGSNNKIALDGFYMLTFPENKIEFRFVSPFEGAQRILLKLEHKKVNGIWQSTGQLDYPANQKIEISSQVGWENTPKFNLEVKTPYRPLQLLFIDLDHSGPADNFKTKIQVEHNLMGGRAILNLDSDVSNLEDIKIQLGFTSPYQQVSFIRSGFTHKKTGKKYNTAYTFEYPGYKSSITNDLLLKKKTDFDEKLTLEYGTSKIETGLKFDMQPVFRIVTFLKTPYDGYRSSSFNVQFDNRENTLLSTEVVYGNAQRIAGNLDYRNTAGSIVGSIGVETPFEGYTTTSLNFNHQGAWNNFKNGGTLTINGRTFEANGEFRYRNSGILKMSGNMKTPYEQYRTISLLLEHEGEPLDMKQKFEFVYGANKIEVGHEFKFRNSRLFHKLLIITPFSDLSSFKSEIKHNGPLKSFRNEGTVEYNGRVFTGNTQFTYGKKAIRGSITINTPDTYTVSFNHKGNMDSFTNNIQADLSGRSYSANTQFKVTSNVLEASTSIRSPHEQLRQLTASINHRGPYDNFQNSFSVNANGNTYTGEGQMKLVGNEITARAEFKVPQVYGVTIAHKGDMTNFENSFDVTIDTSKYEGSSNFRNVEGSIRGGVSLKIPQEYSLTFAHTGSATNFANDFTLKVDGKTASGNTHFVYADNALTATAGLVLPFKNYRKFNTEIKHRGNVNNFKTEGSLELPLQKVKNLNFEVEHSVKAAVSPEWPEFSTKAAVKYNRKAYGFDVSREGNWKDMTNKGAIIYGGKRFTGELKWRQTGRLPNVNHAGSILITSPYEALQSAETKFTHSINNDVYSGQLQSLVNGQDAYFDVEYTLNNEARKSISITMKEPHPASFNANMQKTSTSFEADTTVNWDTSNSDSNVKVAVLSKVSPKYEYELKVIRPHQTSMLKTDIEYNSDMFNHGATVQWGNGAKKVASYRMSGRKNQNGRNKVYTGTFGLRSPFQNMEASLEHEQKSRSVKTVLEVGNVEKLTITHDFVMREPEFRNFKSDLVFKHPQLDKVS